jgi:hypothetical protein
VKGRARDSARNASLGVTAFASTRPRSSISAGVERLLPAVSSQSMRSTANPGVVDASLR